VQGVSLFDGFFRFVLNIAILLDGDFTRRLLSRKLKHRASVSEIERFCKSVLQKNETLYRTYFYDCPPFDERRPLPVSNQKFDFKTTEVFASATAFQDELRRNQFFTYRAGHLSFDGWKLKDSSVASQIAAPGQLSDADFEPALTQKQVDMKIGLDVAKFSIGRTVDRMLLATSDADFIPAIDLAKSKKVEVVLLSDLAAIRHTKGTLLKAFTSHRVV
jgi:uncharacterized LabA/DUF88 family protein